MPAPPLPPGDPTPLGGTGAPSQPAAPFPCPADLPRFADPRRADPHGFVQHTQRLDSRHLLAAYSQGLFPWSSHPFGWFCPDPRAIFLPDQVHLPRNLPKLQRRQGFAISFDRCFEAVMRACRAAHAAAGSWIDASFLAAYTDLHRLGFAHSVEVWQADSLVGGIYGVQLAGLFAGESMFHRAPNASKVGFSALLSQLAAQNVGLFDAQVRNDFTAQLGVCEVSREAYLTALSQVVPPQQPLLPSRWGALKSIG
jgi:leucyl/phenylalanyl-tRNA--protein transferase